MPKANPVISSDEVNGLIARRLAHLRKSQKFSFDVLTTRSGISKGMLVAIEQGGANPSIGTLCKLAATFRVSLTELLAEDSLTTSQAQIIAPDEAKVLWRGPKGGQATLLVGAAGPDMLELWDWALFPGEKFKSEGHPTRTVELLSVTEGTLALEVSGVSHLVPTAHRAIVNADQHHTYGCHGSKRTRFSMVVHEPSQ